MESLQNQVLVLNDKVDRLYQMIEQLNRKVSQCMADRSLNVSAEIESLDATIIRGRYGYSINSIEETSLEPLEHKDVLMEEEARERRYQGGETELTPEIQIRRLTAQLTAAYNRIAALEEQLLAKRIL